MSISSIETIYPYFPSEKKGEKNEEKSKEKNEEKSKEKNEEKDENFLKIKSNNNVNRICRQIVVNNDNNIFLKNEHLSEFKNNKKYDTSYMDGNKSIDHLIGHSTKIDVKKNSEIKIKDVEMNQVHDISLEKIVESNCFEKNEKKNEKTETCVEDVEMVENHCNIQNNNSNNNNEQEQNIVTNNNNKVVHNEENVNGPFVENMEEKKNENKLNSENYKSTPFIDDKKKVIINDIKDNNIPDNFNYLYDILEKKYKENIDLDGSEYVYIYDICTKNENYEKYNSDKICYYISNSEKSTEVDSNNPECCQSYNNKILNLNNKSMYLNFFNNFSNKFIKIKKMFSPTEIVDLTESHFNDNESEVYNLETVLNNKNNKYNKRVLEINDKINEYDIQTITDSTKSEASNNSEYDHVKKSKFIDKINYIFYTVIKNNNYEKNDNGKDEKIISNNILNTSNYQKNKNIYELKKINMDKINSNMKLNINRRVFETDIYDIEIKKRGYTYIYIDNDCWKQYYCIVFYLNNNSTHKDNLILKHYCKIYEGKHLYSNYDYSEWYTNCFIVFFRDNNFDFVKKNNIDLSIFIRKNMYEFIFEISNNHKIEIMNNIHFEFSEKVNKCIVIFDIHSMPYYLIPFEYTSQNSLYDQNLDLTFLDQRCESSFNFIYTENILNSWIYYINILTQKYIKRNAINVNKNKPIKRIHYVNKKFNQWIEVFKQERNIKRCGQIY
ncbi:conserved Plasmodium protein, unknown function [Plasmodium berghei]|uniref:Uncharacterized protein n=2 Tax=Plasmodium berghei TaxID=5821 RepID=A0A509AEF3_PLABA|nr:conserved Plasmodium protein, unknown function [Plasmodium berghei ANKA]SCM19271.1 conserved Plasmodium protein, unknown function [Plasmodium berghei]SCN21712.1 conserved Plasmodium protein, unknown function [Plasmodium berghei]SCO58986.1 conserved Plasmodium protein, unknown function [Plasmodium berghei]VUC53856.1 conserved Plasmodium protein, unknown function [Plasmodium berghei ANKA]|eukprot:XP_034419720.1 conserved Plasmodium protein, unknown function [Plasmodium berghei ANKA]